MYAVAIFQKFQSMVLNLVNTVQDLFIVSGIVEQVSLILSSIPYQSGAISSTTRPWPGIWSQCANRLSPI